MLSGSSQPRQQPAGWAGRKLPKPARRSQGRLPEGGAPCERNRGRVGIKDRHPQAPPSQAGRQLFVDWSLGGEGLSLAAAQGRAPQEGPSEGSPCLSLAKECGFTSQQTLALGYQDCARISRPQDSAQGLGPGRCEIRRHGTHEHGAAASSTVYLQHWSRRMGKCTPFHTDGLPGKTATHGVLHSLPRAHSERSL